MLCGVCSRKAVFSSPALCAEHLVSHVHEVAQETIDEHGLCSREDRVCVAASGGKDSVALLLVLKELGYRVEALAVDEGIAGYREHSLADLRRVCEDNGVPLRVVSFEELAGKPLDAMVEGRYPCSVCGVFRRHLLNRYAKGYDVIATGHNLDDEAQSVLMNLVKGNRDLLRRSHLRSPPAEGFTPRIKPFFFLSERMILAYTVVRGLSLRYVECPYATRSLRAQVRDALNRYEQDSPGMKRSLAEAALGVSGAPSPDVFSACPLCGEPSTGGLCRACRLRKEVSS